MGFLALIAALYFLFLCEASPFAPAFYRFAASRATRSMPGLHVGFQRAGLRIFPDTFSISEFKGDAGDFGTLKFDKLTVSYRLIPVFHGRASLRDVTLRDVVVKVDANKTFPIPTPKPGTDGNQVSAPADLSKVDFASLDASNVKISVSFVAVTGAPPTELVLHDLRIKAGPGIAGSKLPIGFTVDGMAAIDGGSSAVVRCTGGFALKPGGMDAADVDIDLAVSNILMKDFNRMIAPLSPFLINTGTLDCHFDARCRDGRLAGLASIEAREFSIVENGRNQRIKFLQLSLGMWQMLVRDGKGRVKVDANIGGRMSRPDIPIGPVLFAQLGTAGRNVTVGVLNAVPIGFVRDIGKSLEKNADEEARYDDVLKIDRLDKKERHFQRARHYERIVKNSKMAVEEYQSQVQGYPKETDLAVGSLVAMAEIKVRQLKDPRGAVAALRQLVDAYASHPDADDAMLRMIDIAIEARDYSNADKFCVEFGEKFQDSGLLPAVQERRQRIAKYVW